MKITKGKILLVVGIIILLLGIPTAILFLGGRTSFRLGATTISKPENVQVSNITQNSAVISWTTQGAVQGLVSYGLTANNLTLVRPETSSTTTHQIELGGLMAQSNYYFVIKIEDKIFDNNGQPFSFLTLSKAGLIPTPEITTVPTGSLTEAAIEAAMGTNNPTYDLNKDGLVNSFDLLLFRQQNK